MSKPYGRNAYLPSGRAMKGGTASVALFTSCSALLVVVMTLAPFTFDPAGFRDLSWRGVEFTGLVEPFANVLLFVPFGFGVTALLQRWINSGTLLLFGSVVCGIGLSLGVELAQMGLPSRISSLIDLLTNSTGVVVGIVLYGFYGAAIGLAFFRICAGFSRRRIAPRVTASTLLFVAVALYVSARLGGCSHAWSLRDWDPSFSVALGNDATNDRPWYGRLGWVSITDRALEANEIERFLENLTRPIASHAVLVVPPTRNSVPASDSAATTTLSQEQNSRDGDGAREAIARISLQEAFSITMQVGTDVLNQEGPTPIFSIADHQFLRNVTIAQEGRSLNIRIRTPLTGPNAIRPQFVITDYFKDRSERLLAITYDGKRLRFWDSGGARYEARLFPEATVAWIVFTSPRWVYLRQAQADMYRLLYYAFIFLPLGMLCALQATRSRRRVLVGLAGGLVTAFAMQFALRSDAVLEGAAVAAAFFVVGFLIGIRVLPSIINYSRYVAEQESAREPSAGRLAI